VGRLVIVMAIAIVSLGGVVAPSARAQGAIGVMADTDARIDNGAPGVVGNPGEVRLVFDRVEAAFNNRIVSPARANLGLVWSTDGEPACADGRNNDDHRTLGRGVQDTHVDFPADPECVSNQDASEDKAGLQQRRPVVFAGTVDRDGRLFIPASGIDIPTVWVWSETGVFGGDQVHTYDFEPVGDVIGTVDPFENDISLHMRFRIRISVEGAESFTGPGTHCYVGTPTEPIAVRLTTLVAYSQAGLPTVDGVGYDAHSGELRLVGYNMRDVPGATDCGVFGALSGVVGEAFGVPAARGNIRLSAMGRIERPLVAADGATPEMVRLPRELFPSAKTAQSPVRTSKGLVFSPTREPPRAASEDDSVSDGGGDASVAGGRLKSMSVAPRVPVPLREPVPRPVDQVDMAAPVRAVPGAEPELELEPSIPPVPTAESPVAAVEPGPEPDPAVPAAASDSEIEPLVPTADRFVTTVASGADPGADGDADSEPDSNKNPVREDDSAQHHSRPRNADDAPAAGDSPSADDQSDPATPPAPAP